MVQYTHKYTDTLRLLIGCIQFHKSALVDLAQHQKYQIDNQLLWRSHQRDKTSIEALHLATSDFNSNSSEQTASSSFSDPSGIVQFPHVLIFGYRYYFIVGQSTMHELCSSFISFSSVYYLAISQLSTSNDILCAWLWHVNACDITMVTWWCYLRIYDISMGYYTKLATLVPSTNTTWHSPGNNKNFHKTCFLENFTMSSQKKNNQKNDKFSINLHIFGKFHHKAQKSNKK